MESQFGLSKWPGRTWGVSIPLLALWFSSSDLRQTTEWTILTPSQAPLLLLPHRL